MVKRKMNFDKELNLKQSIDVLTHHNITWESFNNNLHWKIGKINFFPTTQRWNDEDTGERAKGLESLLKHIRKPNIEARKYLSVEQMFTFAKKVTPMNLEKVCEVLHKEIYK